MVIKGGCLCGAVRYEAASAPVVTRICWCRLCQYIGAGSATVNSCFAKEGFKTEGALSAYRSVADSGNVIVRSFCPTCGTHLFSEAEIRPHLIFARVGTLDDPEIAKPAMTIWTSQAPSWACIHDDLPQIERQPPPVA